jgi:ectoine hydroxylase-related dioxygenase (phytanoyl-CoA dioxygenase family)
MVQVLSPARLSRAELQADRPWCDREDWPDTIARGVDARSIDPALASLLTDYCRDGVAVVRGAVDPAPCRLIWTDIDRSRSAGLPLLVNLHHESAQRLYDPAMDLRELRFLHVDTVSAAALQVISEPLIVALIRALHVDPPIALKVAAFPHGSRQRAHADLPQIPLRQPLRVVVAWIACESIGLDGGPVFYCPGSHRWPPHDFGGDNVLFDADPFDDPRWRAYEASLEREIDRRGAERRIFTAACGDLLLWHPLLVHGGMPVHDPAATRRSLVCHYGVLSTPLATLPAGPVLQHGPISYCRWPLGRPTG